MQAVLQVNLHNCLSTYYELEQKIMKFKSALLMPIFAAAVAFTGSVASAATYQSFLEYTQVPEFGPTSGSALGIPKLVTPAGLVTVVEGGLNGNGNYTYLDVSVQLASGFRFIDVGAHYLFSYNLNLPSAVSISFVDPTRYQAASGLPDHNPPFGPTFSNAVTCSSNYTCKANPGGSPGNQLLFRITDNAGGPDGIEIGDPVNVPSNVINQLISTTDGWWFAADVANLAGNTGAIGARDFVLFTAVPEPETYAMMLTGLGLLGFAARRRRKQGT